MAAKIHPFNARIGYNSAATTVVTCFTSVADVKSITVGGVEIAEMDTTHLASSNAFKESLASWGKEKPLGFTMYFDETRFITVMETIAFGRATYSWMVTIPDSATPTDTTIGSFFYATGFISDVEIPEFSTDNDDAIMVNVQITPTGRPDLTA